MADFTLKNNIYKVSLIILLFLSGFACYYTVRHYESNNIEQRLQFNMGRNRGDNLNPSGNEEEISINNDKNGQENRIMKKQSGMGETPNNEIQSPQQNANQANLSDKVKRATRNGQPGQFTGGMPGQNGNSKYLFPLSLYSAVFFLLSWGIYYLLKIKKIQVNLKDEKFIIFNLLAIGFLLRIAVATLMTGYAGDISLFKNWAEVSAKGFSDFYNNARQADYPPLYIYVLALVGKIASISIFNPYYVLILKIPSILADVITANLIYKLGKRQLSSVISIFLGIFYLFNPAIFIDSTFWGQVDSFFTLLIVSAIYFLYERKYILSSGMFAIAILMKPQGIIFLPILFIELVRERKIKNFIYSAVSALIVAFIIVIPFSLNQQNPLWIINLYTKTISEYPYASVNAFNFFSLIGGNYKDYNSKLFIADYHTIGILFIVVTTLLGWFVYIKCNDRKYISAIAFFQIAGVFTFSVGMHERYLFPAVALAVLSFVHLKDRRFFILALGFSITSYINIAVILFNLNKIIFNWILIGTSILNILLVMYLVKVLLDNSINKSHSKNDKVYFPA